MKGNLTKWLENDLFILVVYFFIFLFIAVYLSLCHPLSSADLNDFKGV